MSKPRLTKPTSIRFTPQERARIDVMLKELDISFNALVRLSLFSKDMEKSYQRLISMQHNRMDSAKSLGALLRSNIPNNLNQLVKAMHCGTLEYSEQEMAVIYELYHAVTKIHRILLNNMGVRK